MVIKKQVKSLPKYQIHKPSGRAFVWWDGKRHYLGKVDSPESWERYHQFISEITRIGRNAKPVTISEPLTPSRLIGELMLAFIESLRKTVCPGEVDNYRYSFRELRKLYAHTPVDRFGPKDLKCVRQAMIDAGLCRKVVNRRISRIQRMFKWGVAEELVPASVYDALKTVEGLREGQSEAREKDSILPVPDDAVNRTLPYLSPTTKAIVLFQRLTGARPSEACRAKGRDFDKTEPVWLYQLDSHKNRWRGKQRIIPVGPKAQEILKPFLDRDPDEYLFRPEESAKAQRERFVERISSQRKTKQYPSELAAKSKRKAASTPTREYNEYYTTKNYRQAVRRAIEQARKIGEDIELWSPNQLRHSRATEVRKKYGLEAAQVTLGHSKADVTQIYAERDLRKAIQIAQETG